MASETSSLLLNGWENLWKNRVLWLFSSLVLVYPLVRLFVPSQKDASMALSVLNLVISLAAIYLTFTSLVGTTIVAYCIAIEKPIDWRTAFRQSQDLLGRIIALYFVVFLILVIPFGCVFAFFFWQVLQVRNISHDLVFASIPFSVLTAMLYFPIIETIKNDSRIRKSLEAAWAVFTHHFISLAIVGVLLMIGLRVINISVGMTTMLIENELDVSALGQLDFISPQLSFTNNSFYNLMTSLLQMIWQMYGISVFTFAYLKYSGAKMSKQKNRPTQRAPDLG